MTPLFFSTNTLGHFPSHFPAPEASGHYNLFVFEKKTKRIFASPEASGGGKPPTFGHFTNLGLFSKCQLVIIKI